MEKIPKNIADKCPKYCPKCKKTVLMVFRTWKGKNKRVSVQFIHQNSKLKNCYKTYDY